MTDAHHRVAAAAELEREGKTVYIPVDHRNPDDQYTFRRIGGGEHAMERQPTEKRFR